MAIALTGCGKKSIWETAAADLSKARAEARAAGLATTLNEIPQPKLAPDDNAATLYIEITKKWSDPSRDNLKRSAEWRTALDSNADITKHDSTLEKHKDLLDLARLASSRKDCFFQLEEAGISADQSYYAATMDMIKGLSVAAVIAAKRGDHTAVRRDLVAIQNIARHLDQSNGMIGDLMSVGASKLGIMAAVRVLGEAGPSFAAEVEAAANRIPSPDFKDGLDYESAGGVAAIRHLTFDEPGYEGAKAAVDRGLTEVPRSTIVDAFEVRHLQFWTKIAKAGTKTNQEFGKLMDDLRRSAPLDDTNALGYSDLSHEQTGNAVDSLAARKQMLLAMCAILRGDKPGLVNTKFRVDVIESGNGFMVRSLTFKPHPKSPRVNQPLIYPFKGV